MTFGQTHSKHGLGGGHVKVIGLAIALMTFGQTLQTWAGGEVLDLSNGLQTLEAAFLPSLGII